MTAITPRNVLITGAASGIGKAVATALLADGHKVTVVDVNPESLARAEKDLGPSARVHFVRADITSEADCERGVAEAVERFGSLQVLFNNAGIGMGTIRGDAEVNHPSIEELTPAIWERFFNVNCLGPIRMTRAAIAQLKTGGWGRITEGHTCGSHLNAPNDDERNQSSRRHDREHPEPAIIERQGQPAE